jgi:cytochrome c-type biogenesis protein CcmH/NrfG
MTAMATSRVARVACWLATGLLLAAQPGGSVGAQRVATRAASRIAASRIDAREAVAVDALVLETMRHPRRADAWRRLGAAYEAAGMRLLAIRSYRRSLRLDPRDASAARRLRALDERHFADGSRLTD